MNNLNLAVSNIEVFPGTGTTDSLVATKNGYFIARIKFNIDSEPDLTKIRLKLTSFKIGDSDALSNVSITPLGEFKSDKKDSSYTVSAYSIITARSSYSNVAFDKNLTYIITISIDGGTTWEQGTSCSVRIYDNTGVNLDNLPPLYVGRNANIDVNPIDNSEQPSATNNPVLIQFKSLDKENNPVPNSFINIGIDYHYLQHIDNNLIRFFIVNANGDIGDEIYFDHYGFVIRSTVPTDSNGIATIACYATKNLDESDGVISVFMGVALPSNMLVYAKNSAVLITRLNFNTIENTIEIQDEQGNDVNYEDSKTGFKVCIPEYQDYDPTDVIIVINKENGSADDTVQVCACMNVSDGEIFAGFNTDISYLDVVPNSWNIMQFIILQNDNIKISEPNLWRFISPSVIDVDPPKVTSTEPLPDLIFTSEDGKTVHHIGEQYGYSLNSSCINYGGKLELTINFDTAHVQKDEKIEVLYGIKAFKESLGHRQQNNKKDTLSNDLWIITDADITAKMKTIELPQEKFIGYDEDEFGNLGSMWIIVKIGLACYSALLKVAIDTVGPGE